MSVFSKFFRSTVFIMFSFALASCGGSHRAGECAETARNPCLTQKVCTHDASKGCDMCYCDSVDYQQHLDENKDVNDEQSVPYWR
jgi:hypothetical protein